ncbi:hypothetical protein [Streptomyces lydicus]|uniref:hypothetical protein n=1 Tax=Streptomyces lydicus TaxID=47763 RepID=UPI00342055C6
MDTILVSVVSVLGTIAGSALTALVAARSERRRQAAQDAAERRSQHYDLHTEHVRWRRERRHSTYLSFLKCMSTADRANQAYFHHLNTSPRETAVDDERLAEIRRLFKDAEAASHAVVLEGPDEAADASQNLTQRLASLTEHVREYALAKANAQEEITSLRELCHTTGMAYIAEHHELLRALRTALDEPMDLS